MDIPELMTKTECRQMMDDFSRRMQQQGLSMEQYFQFTGQSMDKMMEDMKPQALKRIQTRLVLEKVAEAENIQPSEEEITEEIQKMQMRTRWKLTRSEKLSVRADLSR